MSATKKMTELREKLRGASDANQEAAAAALKKGEDGSEEGATVAVAEEQGEEGEGSSEATERNEKPKARSGSKSRKPNGSDEARFERVSGVLFSELEIMNELKDVIREECGTFPNTAQTIRVAFKLAQREMSKRTVVKGLFEETKADDQRRKKKR